MTVPSPPSTASDSLSAPVARRFPDGFLWGAATSAYQIEGSPLADGAGPSTWHRFAHTPGMVRGGDTGDVACDHYHRAEQDDRLVDGLLRSNIQPVVTLFHWDLPAALDDRGGWLNPDSAGWFADYAQAVVRALDDRVAMWTTLNEPWVVADGGYLHGTLAPGHRSLYEPPLVTHNLLRAHGAAVDVYRALGRHRIGLVVNLEPKYPASDRPADVEATTRADAYMNRQYLDPVLLGTYPTELRTIFGAAWPDHAAAEL